MNVCNCNFKFKFKYETIVGGVLGFFEISRGLLLLKPLKMGVSSFLNYFLPVETVKNEGFKRLFFDDILLQNSIPESSAHKKTALNIFKAVCEFCKVLK